MQIPHPIVIMDMKYLQPKIQRSDKVLEIKTGQISMSRIKTEPQNFCTVLIIQPVNPFRRFPGVAAGTLYDMPPLYCCKDSPRRP